jgi:Zn-dependent protease
MTLIDGLFVVVVIIFSAVVHEVMHGVAADMLGDKTARYAGRLTLNPISHLDPIGSIILPLFFTLSHSPIFFGWAKPVPYNPYNLRPGRFSEAIVAVAGPASNLAIAIICGLFIRSGLYMPANTVIFTVVVINIMLCFFNLIPIPPLDGSKILTSILPSSLAYQYGKLRTAFERNPIIGMIIAVVLINLLGSAFGVFVYSVAGAIAGM